MRTAGWKRWLFVQGGPIVRAGRDRPLSAADAPALQPELEPRAVPAVCGELSLARFWPFILRLYFAAGDATRTLLTLMVARLAVAISTPLLLRAVLERLPQAHDAPSFPYALLALAVLLGVAGLFAALLTQHFYYQALRIRTILVNALNQRVVEHALRLRRSARARMETGDLVNHLGSDSDAVAESGFFLSEGLMALLAMGGAFALLGVYLGWAALAAAGALLLLSPLTALLGRRFRRFDHRIMEIRDKRTTLMSQILHGIRVVKYHAWESSLRGEVQAIREQEIRTRISVVSTDVVATAIWVSTATVVAFAAFGAHVLLGGSLSAELVFPCLALFAMLEEPFGLMSHILARIQHARVATSRLHAYFEASTRERDERALSAPEQPIALRATAVGMHYPGAEGLALADATLEVPAGSSVAIVGPVGAGKSTLLRVLAGIQLPSSGSVEHGCTERPRLAYVPQEAFILNASVRANIEFGGGLAEASELAAIVADCALGPDLAAMPEGLETEIGERGVNLSGGQKQRVALARAAHHRPGVVLLDDPLSAVDVHTEDVLVQRLLFGRLRGVTRVMVTHRLAHLARFDHVVFVVAGKILAQGTHERLLRECAEFRAFSTSSKPLQAPVPQAPLPERSSERTGEPGSGRMTDDEDRETGAVRWPVYRDYLRAMIGTRPFGAPALLAGLLISVAVVAVLPLLQRVWFARFTDEVVDAGPLYAVAVYGVIGLGVLIGAVLQRFLWLFRAAAAGRTLHDQALDGVLGAPLRFFDATPTGRILNRFARDQEIVDDELSWSMEQTCRSLASTAVTLLLMVAVVPALFWIALPSMFVYVQLQRAYRTAAREAKRLESIARSPRYAHFKELVTGLDVIHGFARERFFMDRFYAILEHYQRMHWCNILLNRWFGVRVPLISGALSLGTSVAVVLLARSGAIGGGSAGLVLSYALTLWTVLNWTVRALSEVESFMTQAERLQHYARLAPEPITTAPVLAESVAWPLQGALEFRDVAARYAPHLPRVLDGVSFRVPGGSKVGVIGRTGAGKSTLFQAMFRFIEPEHGAILVDGIPLGSVPLPRLRRALAIIPQDPTLFAGSVRTNLDRFASCSDEQIWAALRRVHLDDLVRNLPGQLDATVAEQGQNFSQGQRQLLCMGRAILTRARLIVLDEATASVDVRTDRLIQETVRSELAGVTVLVIAHRLDTVADADLIIELAGGRVVRTHERERARDSSPRLVSSEASD